MKLYKQMVDVASNLPWPVGFNGYISLDALEFVISEKNIKNVIDTVEDVVAFERTVANCMQQLRHLNPAVSLRITQ